MKNKIIVYSADPNKLMVKPCDMAQLKNEPHAKTTTHENFFIDSEHVHSDILLDELPKEVKGVHYFKTEDEAHNFIKMQIGL